MVLGATALPRRVPAAAAATVALVAIAVQGLGHRARPTPGRRCGSRSSPTSSAASRRRQERPLRTLIHERVPERLHGRAYAAYKGAQRGRARGAGAAAACSSSAIGARWTLLLAGALPVLAALAGLAARRAPHPAPATT